VPFPLLCIQFRSAMSNSRCFRSPALRHAFVPCPRGISSRQSTELGDRVSWPSIAEHECNAGIGEGARCRVAIAAAALPGR
jgi:hypothetical protein